MKNKAMMHTLISCAICLSTMLLYLAFYNKFPDSVPIHWDISGHANRYLPKAGAVFGTPIVCTAINLIVSFRISSNTDDRKVYSYYFFPAISYLIAIVMIVLGIK